MSSVHRSGANQPAAVGQRQRKGQRQIPQNDMMVYGNGIAYGGPMYPGMGYGMYLQSPQSLGQQPPQSMFQHQQQQQQQKQRHKSVGAPCLHTAQRAQMRNTGQSGICSYQRSGGLAGTPRQSYKAPKQPQTQQAFGNWTVPAAGTAPGAAPPCLSGGPYSAPVPGPALAPNLSENATVDQMRMLALMQQQQQFQMQQQQLQQQQVHLQAFSGNSYGYTNYHPQPSGDTSGWGGYAMMQPSDISKPYTFGWSPTD